VLLIVISHVQNSNIACCLVCFQTWSFIPRENHWRTMFRNRTSGLFASVREEVTRQYRKLHSERLHNSFSIINIILCPEDTSLGVVLCEYLFQYTCYVFRPPHLFALFAKCVIVFYIKSIVILLKFILCLLICLKQVKFVFRLLLKLNLKCI
jgi:hypothetical protein